MRTLLALALSASVVLSLAACAPEDRPLPGESATPSQSASPTASETPSQTPTADASGAPIDLSCSQLVSDQVIYDWGNGNFALDPNYAPAVGSSAAEAVAADGVACGWVNLTSGETVAVAAANLSSEELATVTSDLAAKSAAASALGSGGYFRVEGASGHADSLKGSLWVSAESTWFAEAADAKPLMSAAVAAAG